MLLIHCPYCEQDLPELEFTYAGEAHIARPADPENTSDEDWGNYLFFRKNPRGLHHEQWFHSAGCRKFFNVTRDTVSYEILETYKPGQQPTVTAESRQAQASAQASNQGAAK